MLDEDDSVGGVIGRLGKGEECAKLEESVGSDEVDDDTTVVSRVPDWSSVSPLCSTLIQSCWTTAVECS